MVTQNRGSRKTQYLIDLEKRREILQQNLELSKSKEERKLLGQFATPFPLAKEMAEYGLSLLDKKEFSFLEPSLGSGSIYSALLSSLVEDQSIKTACGFEIDSDFIAAADSLFQDETLELIQDDFLLSIPEKKADLLLANPPYTRHHGIDKDKKILYKRLVKEETGIEVSGLSGLYTYFILSSHKWLKEGAICGWLIPCEFLDVNYGSALKEYLLNQVTLLHVHLFEASDVQFDEVQVTSCLLWYKNEKPKTQLSCTFSTGKSLLKPDLCRKVSKSSLEKERKWSRFVRNESTSSFSFRLGDFFSIKRGLVTGDNNFFILNEEEISENNLEMAHFKPILPSPRYLKTDLVESDAKGLPKINQPKFLLDCNLSEEEIQKNHPSLWTYLQKGLETTSKKYLCRNRKLWYYQEKREPTSFLCSYMGRSKNGSSPLRFILNDSQAIAANSYLMLYPKENLQQVLQEKPEGRLTVWKALKAISKEEIEAQGRVYGGGLHKIEPKEMERIPCPDLVQICYEN